MSFGGRGCSRIHCYFLDIFLLNFVLFEASNGCHNYLVLWLIPFIIIIFLLVLICGSFLLSFKSFQARHFKQLFLIFQSFILFPNYCLIKFSVSVEFNTTSVEFNSSNQFYIEYLLFCSLALEILNLYGFVYCIFDGTQAHFYSNKASSPYFYTALP